ncbi:hypothetical protein GCM10010440_25170 [Kitasatospora cinereorecta]
MGIDPGWAGISAVAADGDTGGAGGAAGCRGTGPVTIGGALTGGAATGGITRVANGSWARPADPGCSGGAAATYGRTSGGPSIEGSTAVSALGSEEQ